MTLAGNDPREEQERDGAPDEAGDSRRRRILLDAGIALSRVPNGLAIGAGIVLLGVLAWCATAPIR